MRRLLNRRDQVPFTEGIVKSIARYFDAKMMSLLLDRRGDQITITKKAAGNDEEGKELVTLLLDQTSLCLSQEVIEPRREVGPLRFPAFLFQLHDSMMRKKLVSIRTLLADNVPADITNLKGQSPLWQAACGAMNKSSNYSWKLQK
jgi:hypothetical protein